MAENFVAKTDIYEGPLDLLLSLIEKRKLFINDISLSKVSDDFIKYIETKENFPMGATSDFILIASTLLLIKSKSLLPNLDLSSDEQSDIDDLERRLEIDKVFKEISNSISKVFGDKIIFTRGMLKVSEVVFTPDESINIHSLQNELARLISELSKKESLPKVTVQKIISLEDMIIKLTERVNESLSLSFKEFSHTKKGGGKRVGRADKLNIIVGFLALLELVRRGIINANQSNSGSDIEIETKSITTPTYQQ